MKIAYTTRQPDLESQKFSPPEGPFKCELSEFLFVEIDKQNDHPGWFGVMPTYEELNSTFLEGHYVDVTNIMFDWEPFRISQDDFEKLLLEVKANPKWGIEIEFPTKEEQAEEDYSWGHWALCRFIGKQSNG